MHIGFVFAYPKRVQKLLVDRSQTLLIYYLFDLFVAIPHLALLFLHFLFIFVVFLVFVWVFVH